MGLQIKKKINFLEFLRFKNGFWENLSIMVIFPYICYCTCKQGEYMYVCIYINIIILDWFIQKGTTTNNAQQYIYKNFIYF